MHPIPYILASDEGLVKLAFWVVIILIVGIAKLVGFIKKAFTSSGPARPANAPPPMRNQPTRSQPARNQPMPAAAQMRGAIPPLPANARPLPLPPLASKAKKVKRKVARKVQPAAMSAQADAPLMAILEPRIAPAAVPPVAVAQSQVAGWVNARTIRSQFILAEAMKPPLSLK